MSCGSFGLGPEGRLLTCSQCGQCYHPYCVNIKVGSSHNNVFPFLASCFSSMRAYVIPILSVRPSGRPHSVEMFKFLV